MIMLRSSVASVFSVGSSVGTICTMGDVGPDLEDAMTMYQRGLMDAASLRALLEETFGQQVGVFCVVSYVHRVRVHQNII